MNIPFDDAWKWLRTAPLPVVLVFTLSLGAWVYTIASDQAVEKAKAEGVREKVDKIDGKLDKLLEAVAELKAEQRARDHEPSSAPAPSPTPPPPKEKTR